MEKHSPQSRYCFIELLAFWEGRVNTKDLSAQFNQSRQQCSKDLSDYKSQHPQNLVYDGSQKCYRPTHDFEAGYISGEADQYLNWLFSRQITPLPKLEFTQSLNIPSRKISPFVMRGLVSAIRQKKRVEVDYVSLSNPNREGRIISPHSFVKTGVRWHLRGWCEKSSQYRDFVLSRFRGVPELLEKTKNTISGDDEWNTLVNVILEPDKRLSEQKRQVLEDDYQMQDGQLQISTKGCLVQYLLRELQVSTKILDGTPEAQQLVCVNLADIKPWLFDG